MGFLSDVGRANLLGNVMGAGQFIQQSQTNQLQQQLLQAKITEQERLNRPKLLSELVGKGAEQRPATMKIFADAVKMAGMQKITGPNGEEDYVITQADLPTIQKFLETRKDLHIPLLWAERSDNSLQIDQLNKQLGKGAAGEEMARLDRVEKLKKRNAEILDEIRKGEGGAADQFGEKASDFKVVTLGEDPEGNPMPPGKGYRYQAVPDPSSPQKFKLHPLGPSEDTRTATNIVLGQDQQGNIVTMPSRGEPTLQRTPLGGELQPKVAPTIPTEQTTVLQQIDTLGEALNQVTDLYEESFVGPVAGPTGKISDDWGILPNAKRSEFRALVANLYNTIIYLRSGKQINEEEAKRLLNELPTMNVSPVSFQAKLKKFTWELNSIRRNRLRELKGAGYRNVPEPEQMAPTGGGAVRVERGPDGKLRVIR